MNPIDGNITKDTNVNPVNVTKSTPFTVFNKFLIMFILNCYCFYFLLKDNTFFNTTKLFLYLFYFFFAYQLLNDPLMISLTTKPIVGMIIVDTNSNPITVVKSNLFNVFLIVVIMFILNCYCFCLLLKDNTFY
jgi:hypothetical protein